MGNTHEVPEEKKPSSGVDPNVLDEILRSYKDWRFKLPPNEFLSFETQLPPLENRLKRLPRREYEDFYLGAIHFVDFAPLQETRERDGNSDFQAGAGSADADDAAPDTGGSQ